MCDLYRINIRVHLNEYSFFCKLFVHCSSAKLENLCVIALLQLLRPGALYARTIVVKKNRNTRVPPWEEALRARTGLN